MLKTRAGDILGNAQAIPVEPEALSVDEAARTARISRTFLYQALNPDPKYRKGVPFLASLKLGRARRIRLATLRQWLAAREQAEEQQRSAGP